MMMPRHTPSHILPLSVYTARVPRAFPVWAQVPALSVALYTRRVTSQPHVVLSTSSSSLPLSTHRSWLEMTVYGRQVWRAGQLPGLSVVESISFGCFRLVFRVEAWWVDYGVVVMVSRSLRPFDSSHLLAQFRLSIVFQPCLGN